LKGLVPAVWRGLLVSYFRERGVKKKKVVLRGPIYGERKGGGGELIRTNNKG